MNYDLGLYRAALIQDRMLTTNQPNGSRLNVINQLAAKAIQAKTNQKIADSEFSLPVDRL